jgi:hypothetical protein
MKLPCRLAFAALLSLFSFVPLAGCGAGGGGGEAANAALEEREPNGSPATARALAVGRFGHGRTANPADVDFWALELAAGQVIALEVFGSRLDQAAWSLGPNAPRVALFDADGTSELRLQGADLLDWGTDQDTDLLSFRAPAAGTYFVRLAVDNGLLGGGEYLLLARDAAFSAPVQDELEPPGFSGANDTDATAETIVPGTLLGHYVDDEQDWFGFAVAEPSLVRFEISAHRNGVFEGDDAPIDPELALFDGTLTQLDLNDDAFYLDSALQYLVTTPGTYLLRMAECCGSGDGAYALRFELEPLSSLAQVSEVEPNDAFGTGQTILFDELVLGSTGPGDPDEYRVACNAGDRLWVEIYDLDTRQGASANVSVVVRDALAAVLPSDVGGELRTLRTMLPSSGDFHLLVTAAGATDYALRVRQRSASEESEPNDDLATAQAFDLDGRRAGAIATPGDVDVFSFEATRKVPIVFTCFADDVAPDGFSELNGFGSALDPLLRVRDANGVELASARSSAGTAVGTNDGLAALSLVFLPPATGSYVLEVADELGSSGTDFRYALEVRP